ncbi:MAG: hypothetical protein KatS3mg103_0638 [Phycisphaerales bacterium]|nr:MAG: hypothetical protein KatS3mg103_0638 [Phycisphaerales bacterium]
MASAILRAAARADLLDGPCVVAEPDESRRRQLAAIAPSIDAVPSVAEAFEALPYEDATVLLAVKPQNLAEVIEELGSALGPDPLHDRGGHQHPGRRRHRGPGPDAPAGGSSA